MIIRDLFYGSWGLDVQELQRGLKSLGYGNFLATGFFGSKTLVAVISFQKANGIRPDYGYFGQKTRPIFYEKLSADARVKVWQTALTFLGKDASPDDLAPDEYGCAETVSDILIASGMDFPVCLSTRELYREFYASDVFMHVADPLPGDIIISPTSYGNGQIPNGHTGIFDEGGAIMSNSSASGTFERNYTLASWNACYRDLGGYPVYFIRRLR